MQKRSVVWVGWALLAAGCGSVPQSTKAPPSHPPPEEPAPTTIDEAEASLERGRSRLSQLEAKKEAPRSGDKPPNDPVAPPPSAPQGAPDAAASPASEGGVCHDVCRTLASMRRAADTICRLAGPDDTRCQGARRKVQEGEERASPCGCRPAVS